MTVKLTQTDYVALDNMDYHYLNNKGAKAYASEDYETAIEYYRLGAAMGCVHSISNLGYCYMYARSIPQNMDLALAYFRLAAAQEDIDAMYKLGNIYKNGANGLEADLELSVYYYEKAIHTIESSGADEYSYPSLYFSIAKELMPGGILSNDLRDAYIYLHKAKIGYEIEQKEGIRYHEPAYQSVLRLMRDPCFDEIHSQLSMDHENITLDDAD